MKETRAKLDLYFQGQELDIVEVHQLLRIITQRATEAGIPMTFDLYEVEVQDV